MNRRSLFRALVAAPLAAMVPSLRAEETSCTIDEIFAAAPWVNKTGPVFIEIEPIIYGHGNHQGNRD